MSRIAINDLTLQDSPFLFDLTEEEMLFITGGGFWKFIVKVFKTIGVIAGVVAGAIASFASGGGVLAFAPILGRGVASVYEIWE